MFVLRLGFLFSMVKMVHEQIHLQLVFSWRTEFSSPALPTNGFFTVVRPRNNFKMVASKTQAKPGPNIGCKKISARWSVRMQVP